MKIRKAEIKDLERLLEIYNYEVVNGNATFDTEPQTPDERKGWFYAHNRDNHPLFVSQEDDGTVSGYVSLSCFNPKPAYDGTVELSVYVAKEYRGRGIAGALMEFIIDFARRDEKTRGIVSLITSENAVSKRLHKKFGFEYCGTLKEAGFKFGRYLDVDFYELSVKNEL